MGGRMMGKKRRILGEKGRTRKSKQRNRKGNYQKHGQMKKMSEKYEQIHQGHRMF